MTNQEIISGLSEVTRELFDRLPRFAQNQALAAWAKGWRVDFQHTDSDDVLIVIRDSVAFPPKVWNRFRSSKKKA